MFPNQGPDDAAGLTDAQLERLMQTLHWELAVRLDRESYERLLRMFSEARDRSDEQIAAARAERERMAFTKDVLRDIAALPVKHAA